MIVEALRRGENVYNIALQLDPEALLPAAAFELARKSLESCGQNSGATSGEWRA